MRITTITVCYNEEKILPFFLDYYSSFCDEIIIFDGNSTDNTVSIIQSYARTSKCNIELRISNSPNSVNGYDEELLSKYLNFNYNLSLHYIRNNAWKNLFTKDINDWIIVVDVDEFMYHPDGLRNKLSEFKQNGITYPNVQGFNMISDYFPSHIPGKFLFDEIKGGFWWKDQCKKVIFDSKHIQDINFLPGCHYSNPVGNLVSDNLLFQDQIKSIHYRYLGYDFFKNQDANKYKRLSNYDIQNRLAVHYKQHSEMSLEDYNNRKLMSTYHTNVFVATQPSH